MLHDVTFTEEEITQLRKKAAQLSVEASIAIELYRKAVLGAYLRKVKFKKGEKIQVLWTTGPQTYFFESIEFHVDAFCVYDHPRIHVRDVLKNNKPSKLDYPLESAGGYLRPDDPIIRKL